VKNPYDPSEPVGWFNMKNKSQMSSAGVSTTSGWDSAFTAGHDADGNGSYYDVNDYLPYGAGAIEYTGPPSGYGYDGNHTMMSGDHGVTEAVVPNVGTIQMYSEAEGGDYVYDDGFDEYVAVAPGTGTHLKGYYHGEAGLSVILKEDGTWTAHDADGADVSASLTGAVTIKNLYDARQGGNVKVAQIEMDKVNSSGVFPANGLMYSSWYGLGSGKKANGIKLKSGQELKAPLTIVSESHIYVQGNYNTVNKKGASVIGDAVSLLSNAWNDTKTSASALPAATETTYNLALITGNHDTVGSGYNGGLENLPRFHEKWSGVPCNITGSLVNTWRSTFATGTWFYGGKNYEAPNRNWNYDVAFNNIANLPPYTPLAVTGREVVSW
jgi:hypothetical protein